MNKTSLIIGAKSDIAIACAYEFAKNGFDLQLAARDVSELCSSAQDLKIRFNIDVSLHELDVLEVSNFNSFIDSLSVLPDVTLCAIGLMGDQNNCEKDFHSSMKIFNTNFSAPSILLGLIAMKYMNAKRGTIIGISSVAGLRVRGSNYFYGSAKSAFIGFLSGLRSRLHKSGIKVVTVIPGFIDTKMTKHLKLPPILTSQPEVLAKKIYKAYIDNKDILYSSLLWRIIMLAIRLLPETIFKKLEI